MERVPTAFPHLVQRPPPTQEREDFTPLSGGDRSRRKVDNVSHARLLADELSDALRQGLLYIGERQDTALSLAQTGYFLKFIVAKFDPEDFDRPSFGIRLLNVQKVKDIESEEERFQLLVFVPRTSYTWLQERIQKYEATESKNAQSDISWIDRIETARDISSFWTSLSPIPEDDGPHYWEVWIDIDGENAELDETFMATSRRLQIARVGRPTFFESRSVHLVHATRAQLEQLVVATGAVAELRRPSSPAQLLREMSMAPGNIATVASRVTFNELPPRVALFDTGVSVNHPLLMQAFARGPALAADPSYGVDDDYPHGTAMAGLILYGDLTEIINAGDVIRAFTSVESIKVLPRSGAASTVSVNLFGQHYTKAVNAIETQFGRRPRIFCCAINDLDEFGGFVPSEWSSGIDKLSYFHHGLFVVSAGNVTNDGLYPIGRYPVFNDTRPLLNPGQSWNAITVGGYTQFGSLDPGTYPGHSVVAPAGNLAPQSRTAVAWSSDWPIKPDVVFEAGNFAYSTADTHARAFEDLMLVSTAANHLSQPLTAFGYTSGATALATRFAATLWASMPQLRPETIRALVIHSAEWTPAMRAQFDTARTVKEKLTQLRRFGWGIPQLARAMRSVQNDTTIIIESTLAPAHEKDEVGKLDRHRIVWPSVQLAALGEAAVRIRVTLSWFIEPNPGERGQRSRFRFQSHGYRFRMKRHEGDNPAFYVNRLLRAQAGVGSTGSGEFSEDADIDEVDAEDNGWLLGPKVRNRGSIISDEWTGSALEAASRDELCVYPVNGWWQKSKHQRLSRESPKPYSLVISLTLLDRPDVDIYSVISQRLEQVNVVEITQ